MRRERNRGSCYPLRTPTGYENFGKSSQVWATMTFTNFLKALLILQIYDKTMGVRGNQPWTRCLMRTWCQIWKGLDPRPSSVPQRSFCFPRRKLNMVVCMCASNSTRDCTVACGGQVSSSGKSQEGFVDPDEAALSSTPQCPFPSLSWSGYIPCVLPTPRWGGFSEPSDLDDRW